MGMDETITKLLDQSNYKRIKSSLDDFSDLYIKKLLENIILYVDPNVGLGEISLVDSYHLEHELSQDITGCPSAYSAIDGNIKVLTAFAESYSNLGIAEFNSLCKEALLDFMNMSNGLFVVELSNKNICELSLSVPKQNGNYNLSSDIEGKITMIPVNFSYGTITFLLLKTA